MTILVVCGLKAEARIARGRGTTVIAGGGDGVRLAAAIDAAVPGTEAILSFGVAGGLDPQLRPGDMRVAMGVVTTADERHLAHAAWAVALSRCLQADQAWFAAADAPVGTPADKAKLHRSSGAASIDMETHIVARCAARHGLPWGSVRVVTDSADRALPHAATVGMQADGKVDLPAILASLARDPRQLPGLIRTGLDARAAFASLLRCRQLLGPRFALPDL